MVLEHNSALYYLHELQRAAVSPVNILANVGKQLYSHPLSPMSYLPLSSHMAAGFEVLGRMTKRYTKPQFDLTETVINGRTYKVQEKIILSRPFGNLIKFSTSVSRDLPRLLIVAPLSGHFATLLRGTVEDLLPYCEVFITDWADARDVPLYEGNFTLDDYIHYVIQFLELLGPETHVMAVCQPAVPVLAGVALMSADSNTSTPRSMTLIGGPIDTRVNPTVVNKLATERPLEWFEQHVITRVPPNYPGFMRRVYPGFLQLTGFMQMNLERHIGEHLKLFQHLVEGDGESAEAHRKFYNEYLSVLDLPAEFYLQTVRTVFQEHALPKGIMMSGDRRVDCSKITRTALLTIEGEKDDISGVGQTEAAHRLCTHLPEENRHHHLQKNVGHYGTFNGRRFREEIRPVILEFIHRHEKKPINGTLPGRHAA